MIKKDDKSKNKIGEKVYYQDVVDLKENQITAKEIVYKAPSGLTGTFQLWLSVQNKNGLVIAMSSLGEVKLDSLIEQYGL